MHTRFDVVLLDLPNDTVSQVGANISLLRGAIRATRQGGRLIVSAAPPACAPEALPELVAEAVTQESRVAFSLLKMGAPGDFPTLLGAKDSFAALCVELG